MILVVDSFNLKYSHNNNKKGPVFLAFFCVVMCVFCVSGCSESSQDQRYLLQIDGQTMGTTYAIKAVAKTTHQSAQHSLSQEIDETLKNFNQVMSTYIDDSEISKLNREAIGSWIAISDDLLAVLNVSQEVSKNSAGAFDVTVGPLVNLWGFGPKGDRNSSIPSEEAIARVRSDIGFGHIEFDGNKVRKKRPVYVDLSAVAKGYATDVVAELLEAKGITDYMVEIGGELKIKGQNQRGDSWTIGIEKPALGRAGAMQKVTGDDIAIATSGDYRNYYEKDGVRVSHTISPVTGHPITHNLASVTVITKSGGFADAYATAINVLGPEEGYELAEKANLAAYFVIRERDDFRVKFTESFEQYMVP